MRLHKYLSRAGTTSRRKAEELIAAGRVRVNGRAVTRPGTTVDPDRDVVEVDGRLVRPEEKVYILLHKPAGFLCSLEDRFRRPLVTGLLPEIIERIYPVGRLDLDSEGLLLLTNDGDFALKLTHPRHGIEKTYEIRLRDPLSPAGEAKLRQGVTLEDGFRAGAAGVRIIAPDRREAEVTIREGKKRQVKRMLEAVGNRVTYLKRTAVGPLRLGDLEKGEWRRLTPEEVALFTDNSTEYPISNKESPMEANRWTSASLP